MSVVNNKGIIMMNFGFGYPGMMGMYGPSMGINSGNTNVYFRNKYGCEDCFRTQPYWQEYPKPVQPEPKNSLKPSLFRRFINNVLGG